MGRMKEGWTHSWASFDPEVDGSADVAVLHLCQVVGNSATERLPLPVRDVEKAYYVGDVRIIVAFVQKWDNPFDIELLGRADALYGPSVRASEGE